MYLRNSWYVLAWSRELADKPLAITVMDEPLVVFRDKATTAKLTLTYMAAGFDWQANYVAQVQKQAADGKGKVDMFAWLTLANGGQVAVSATLTPATNPTRAR